MTICAWWTRKMTITIMADIRGGRCLNNFCHQLPCLDQVDGNICTAAFSYLNGYYSFDTIIMQFLQKSYNHLGPSLRSLNRRLIYNKSFHFSIHSFFRCSWWRHQMETFSASLAICAGIHRSPVNSPHKGQWRGAMMFSLICVAINGWVNNREAGNLRHCRAHYDVIVMERFRSKQKSHYFSPVLRTSLTTASPSRVQMYRKISLELYSYMSKVVSVVKLCRQKHKKVCPEGMFLGYWYPTFYKNFSSPQLQFYSIFSKFHGS